MQSKVKKRKNLSLRVSLFSHNSTFQTDSIDKRKLVQAFRVSLLHTILSDNCYFPVYNRLLSKVKCRYVAMYISMFV